MKLKRKDKIILLITLLPYWMLIAIILYPLLNNSFLLLFGTEYKGKVVEHREFICKRSSRSSEKDCYVALVLYKDRAGREYIVDDQRNWGFLEQDFYSVGKETEIIVSPISKDRGRVNNYREVEDEIILHLIFADVVAFLHIYAFYRLKKKYKKVSLWMIPITLIRRRGVG